VQADRIVPLSRAALNLVADMIDLIARWSQVEGEVRANGIFRRLRTGSGQPAKRHTLGFGAFRIFVVVDR